MRAGALDTGLVERKLDDLIGAEVPDGVVIAATLAPLDLTDEGAARGLAGAILDRWGRLDLWVHAAIHAPALAPLDHADPREVARALDLNVTATARLVSLLGPLLRAGAGGGFAVWMGGGEGRGASAGAACAPRGAWPGPRARRS